MSAEVAEAIRQTRRTLAEKTWVPWSPEVDDEVCVVTAVPGDGYMDASTWGAWAAFGEQVGCFPEVVADSHESEEVIDWLAYPDDVVAVWNDQQTDVGAVLGMTLEALIAELCKVSP